MRSLYLLASSTLAFLAHAAENSTCSEDLNALSVANLDDVRGNLYLPPSARGGQSITWSSSDESVVSSDGIVKRQSITTQVGLTASIDCDGTPASREFKASVRQAVEIGPYEGYAFAYFTNNSRSGENIFFAASHGNDALSWQELNGAQPVLKSTYGTTGLRDPFIIRSHEGDTFYLIATDLSIGSGTSWGDSVKFGSRYLEVWESHDLKTWSEQRHVLVSPAEAGNTWAPEAYYDESIGSYVVFWASSLYNSTDVNRTEPTYHRMLYATTRDFVTFSEPQIWQDAGLSRIDSTILKEGSIYYRFTKDEGAAATGCTDIIQEKSTSLRATLESWTTVATCIGKKAGTSGVEGPTAFKSNPGDVNGDKFYLFVDEFGGRGYIPLSTKDIASPNWTVPAGYKLPPSPRHGTVLPITAAELASLTASTTNTSKRTTSAAGGSPVLKGYFADPNIAVFDKTYYIYPTTDGFPGWGGQVFYSWSSPNLVNWTRSEQPFLTLNGTNGNVPWATGNAWAPTIAEKDGKYYFYFSGQNPTYDRKTIGVAIADSPTGPFTAEPTAMILNNERLTTGQAIDGDVFLDPVSGKYYFIWGNGQPLLAELSENMISIEWATAQNITGLEDFREGLFINYRKGLYHLTYSIDDTGSENYRVGYATSTSITGPYTYRGVLLQKDVSQGILATGHNSIINVPGTDEWYIAYHRFAIPGGDGTHREVTIDKVTFDEKTGLMNTVLPTLSSVEPFPVPCN
ncbi:glycoside hydrolase family 43 protein [Aureobasidium subglaciale EXF-2481]|uniref:Endo-1,5-alpha-L-arabinanase A n=1 Tax=Aureobasidium subglaciale (strain EXF-2481) TaxID=1043005 RepID=A0A074YFK6_AURSE|nr:glycoside hydrolase family 43 protein [Aureobasidium subglaciale EXF-2481]KAI5193660.1 Arabinanase/levansucrase/invertase [Aureobasidium subglaciale]KAI5213342.1 Arabinanase/levansucrase/invertase [Aureobasidium subglaciale]KAI5214723.1 Arabinanase/levansucrase/invertase [Aureobasidium subglaciale]KAI5252738.1 Arabinanase/levansucrase/invertase [Aureobasidium subglaciale]KEQ96530.1 glycoside hydrolase family 43 protein [Aureobasidium subglaciale EXF-2481]